MSFPIHVSVLLALAGSVHALPQRVQTHPYDCAPIDSDQDGLRDGCDSCPILDYAPAFATGVCGPLDLNPNNDSEPECKARERVLSFQVANGVDHIAFAVIEDGALHFADSFESFGAGSWAHDPEGIRRFFFVGSITKSMLAAAAKALEENGSLSLDDYVNDVDATQVLSLGEVTLRGLLSHDGAFASDTGAMHSFCYPGDLKSFWENPDEEISPYYHSTVYGNKGGGYEYSMFNYSLAGAYMAERTGMRFADLMQSALYDPIGMCTASTDGARAASVAYGSGYGFSNDALLVHVGPAINSISPNDPFCIDNYYSSNDFFGFGYSSQIYRFDEAWSEARDPAGGILASVVDVAHFGTSLLASYHGTGGLLTPDGVRDLFWGLNAVGCVGGCVYQPFYGLGFFTDTLPGLPVNEVEHPGTRSGFTSAFVLRPEDNRGICILANADVGSGGLSALAKTILDDFE